MERWRARVQDEVIITAVCIIFFVDLMYFLRERTKFVNYLYGETVLRFAEVKRRIEAREEPYIDQGDQDADLDDPPFQNEWENANDAMGIIGVTCLGLLQSALHAFLEDYLKEVGGEELLTAVTERKEKTNWIWKCKEHFRESIMIDWTASGADLELLEQMILSRNDLQHNTRLDDSAPRQGKHHAKQYPNSVFRDPQWPKESPIFGNAPLIVEPDTLQRTIHAIEQLCEYLEAPRRQRFGGRQGVALESGGQVVIRTETRRALGSVHKHRDASHPV